MRLTRLLTAALILPLAAIPAGCSKKAERIAGNERLLRGGLGTTIRQSSNPDRDTYVTPGSANYGPTLLVGRSSSFEGRAFFEFAKFNLPDTNRPGLAVPGNVLFELPQAPLRKWPLDLDVELGTVSAPGDSGMISWPGPSFGTSLASTSFDFTGPLRLDLGPGSFGQFQQWAALGSSSAPRFILRPTATQGIAGFQASAARFRVPYSWNNQGTTVFDTVNTGVTFDLYVHPPLAPAATGADTALVLGGGFESSIALRAPVPSIAPGHSVDELRLVFSVIDSLPAVDGSTLKKASDTTQVTVTLDVYRITGAWTEGATDLAAIPRDALPIATLPLVAVAAGDSLSIALPRSLARGWFENPASNEGVVIAVRSANVNPGIVVGSRESSRPPVLRLSATGPPPGRF